MDECCEYSECCIPWLKGMLVMRIWMCLFQKAYSESSLLIRANNY